MSNVLLQCLFFYSTPFTSAQHSLICGGAIILFARAEKKKVQVAAGALLILIS